jgi:hypothetical protein
MNTDSTNPPAYKFTQEELQRSLNRKREQPAATSGVKFRRNKSRWIALLLIELENAKKAKKPDLAEALEASLHVMGHKFRARQTLPGRPTLNNSGMGESGRPPGEPKKREAGAKGNAEFSGEFADLIASRPDLEERLQAIARTKQQPKIARVAAMKKLIKETPPPAQDQNDQAPDSDGKDQPPAES